MALGILNPETIKGVLVIILILWLFSGKAGKALASLMRNVMERSS